MKKLYLCLVIVLSAVFILCSCSELSSSSIPETVNPSVDINSENWKDCGTSLEEAEAISGFKFAESMKNAVSVKSIPYTAMEVICSSEKPTSDSAVILRKAVVGALKNGEKLSGVDTNGLSPVTAIFEIKGTNFVNEEGKVVVGEYSDDNYNYSFYCKNGLSSKQVYSYIKRMISK